MFKMVANFVQTFRSLDLKFKTDWQIKLHLVKLNTI